MQQTLGASQSRCRPGGLKKTAAQRGHPYTWGIDHASRARAGHSAARPRVERSAGAEGKKPVPRDPGGMGLGTEDPTHLPLDPRFVCNSGVCGEITGLAFSPTGVCAAYVARMTAQP